MILPTVSHPLSIYPTFTTKLANILLSVYPMPGALEHDVQEQPAPAEGGGHADVRPLDQRPGELFYRILRRG